MSLIDFALSGSEKASSLWFRLVGHLEARLAAARQRNDDATLTEAETAAIRGEIRVLKALIRLNDDRPVVTD